MWVAEAACPLKWLPLMEGYAEPEAVLDLAMNGDARLTGGVLMPRSNVACPSRRQLLPKRGADLEAVLE